MSNQELFNKFVIVLLDDLQKKFPKKQNYSIGQFEYLDCEENYGVFSGSIDFLKKEHIIDFREQVYGGFVGVSLTGKGLNLLNSTPSSISKSKTLGNQVSDAIKRGTVEAYNSIFKELLKQASSTIVKKILNE